MSVLLAAAIWLAADPAMPSELIGRYSFQLSEGTLKPKCDRPDRAYLTLASNGVDWGDGVLQPLVAAEPISATRFHLWVKRPATRDVRLLHILIDRDHANAIVIIDEIAQMERLAEAPETMDAGVLGVYARCVK